MKSAVPKRLGAVCLLAALFCACTNPFAPEEGGLGEGLWDNQTTIGGMLDNFQTAYTMRDSLRYADIIAEEFLFRYYDVNEEREITWGREVELLATGRLMRNVDRLDLQWGPLSARIDTFALPDTTVEFTINFSLSAGDYSAISGRALFGARAGDDGRFRLVLWQDNF